MMLVDFIDGAFALDVRMCIELVIVGLGLGLCFIAVLLVHGWVDFQLVN